MKELVEKILKNVNESDINIVADITRRKIEKGIISGNIEDFDKALLEYKETLIETEEYTIDPEIIKIDIELNDALNHKIFNEEVTEFRDIVNEKIDRIIERYLNEEFSIFDE